MNKYWPSRKIPMGFSIKSFGENCRERISKPFKDKAMLVSDYRLDESILSLQIREHWANRAFNEYKN
jgi:hypothetical protein